MTLELLIKRRKTSLKQFVNDAGVQNYGALVALCERMGVVSVDEQTYVNAVKPELVTSQEDGVVVISLEPEQKSFDRKRKISRKHTNEDVEQIHAAEQSTDDSKR